jgi:hypothetical protein
MRKLVSVIFITVAIVCFSFIGAFASNEPELTYDSIDSVGIIVESDFLTPAVDSATSNRNVRNIQIIEAFSLLTNVYDAYLKSVEMELSAIRAMYNEKRTDNRIYPKFFKMS